MIWKGPGSLKFGNGESVEYVLPDTKLSDEHIARLKKSAQLDALIGEGKILVPKVSKPKETVVKKVKKK